ncbi:MAG: MerR family transcriptional regulator [Myxococcota bacterium]|nr:MerR family transcriptional regulator [Myxococcota bacterium]MDW8361481.1 MerR family transcriptional regulator [Myxococcales bacterium]
MLVSLSRPAGRPIRIGTLAARSGKSVRALHLYEELGLLEPIRRSPGGFRLYAPDAVVRVRWIAALQEMGFSLGRIRQLLTAWEESHSAPDAMKRLREIYREKLEETRAARRRLEELERELEASLGYLETCDRCEPQRLVDACQRCDRHEAGQNPPDLVAGIVSH